MKIKIEWIHTVDRPIAALIRSFNQLGRVAEVVAMSALRLGSLASLFRLQRVGLRLLYFAQADSRSEQPGDQEDCKDRQGVRGLMRGARRIVRISARVVYPAGEKPNRAANQHPLQIEPNRAQFLFFLRLDSYEGRCTDVERKRGEDGQPWRN